MEKSGDGDDGQLSAMLKSVEKFQKITNPEIKDLSSILIPFIKFYIENKRMEKLESEVDELAAEVHKLKLDIVNSKIELEALNKNISDGLKALNNTMQSFIANVDKLEISSKKSMSAINLLLQNKIDNDIIICGFSAMVESKSICDNFIKTFHLDPSEIVSTYYFPYDSKFSGKISHNIIIGFREKAAKLKVLARKKEMGPLLDPVASKSTYWY
jgi:hypothetical protein